MAAIKRIIAFAGVVTVLALLGCSNTHRLNGKYEGERDMETKPGTDPFVAHQLAMVQLYARPDGTATLSDQGVALDGHIDYSGDSATFVPETIMGNKVETQNPTVVQAYTIVMTPNSDGSWTYAGTVKLTKKL